MRIESERGYKRLCCAIVIQALADFTAPGGALNRLDAYLFLQRDASLLLDGVDLDIDVSAWLGQADIKALKRKMANTRGGYSRVKR